MGWSGIYAEHAPRRGAELEYIVNRVLTWNNADGVCANRVLLASKRGNTIYAACEQTKAGVAEVWGAVVLIQRGRDGEFRHKEMSEDMGPCERKCPKAILDLLDARRPNPPEEYAAQWRRECRANLAKAKARPLVGTTIELAQPMRFRDGKMRAKFRVEQVRSRGRSLTVYRDVDDGQACRISGIQNVEFTTHLT